MNYRGLNPSNIEYVARSIGAVVGAGGEGEGEAVEEKGEVETGQKEGKGA